MAREVKGTSPINIMKHLKGIKFPMSKDGIVKLAQEKSGLNDTGQVVEVLSNIPDKSYNALPEITREVGKLKQ